MRLLTLYVIVLLVSLIGAQYIPDPHNPDLLHPIRLDPLRPKVRIQRVFVEDPPNNNRLLELLYLIFVVPFLFTGRNGGLFGNGNNGGNGNGGGGNVITEDPCC